MPVSGRILPLERGGDLGQAGVPGHQRGRPAGRSLGCHHAERLGEHRWGDAHVGQGPQMREMAMLQRAGEHDAVTGRRRQLADLRLQVRPLRAEAHDDSARIDPGQCSDQQGHALLRAELAHVQHGGLHPRQKPPQPLGVALVRPSLVVGCGRVRGVQPALLDERLHGGGPVLWPQHVDVHARRQDMDPPRVFARADDVVENARDVLRAGQHRMRRRQRLARPAAELGVAAHRELQL